MTQHDLTPEQAQQLHRQTLRHARYYTLLVARMSRLGFEPTDPLFAAALEACNAVRGLSAVAGYAGTSLARAGVSAE